MLVIHANDPTTKVLSLLYETRDDITMCIDEKSSNSNVQKSIRADDTIMMLGHGNPYGLFSVPDKNGHYCRHIVDGRYVQFLRNKTCIGIWCYANEFAEKYGLHGLFSGMIISDVQEAEEYQIVATKEEIDREMELFTKRLNFCLERDALKDIPQIMGGYDYQKSELNDFNYSHLYYFE